MTVKIVKMDVANYVNKVGKLVNQSTKYNAKLDRVSITNLVLLLHLDKLAKWAVNNLNDEEFPITQDDVDKIIGYLHCLKKQMNFYPEKDIDSDCILTEVKEHIIQE